MFNWKRKNQILSTLCGNLLTISYGASAGWASPSIPILQSDESPLTTGPISLEETAWIASLLCIGGIAGTIFYGWVAGKYGRKFPILSLVIPQIISWLLIIYAPVIVYIYIARFLAGFAGAGVLLMLPLFVIDVSDEKIRGFLGSLLILMMNTGFLLAFILGNYFSYKTSAAILCILPVVFAILFLYFPEVPQTYIQRGNEIEAEKSLMFYRNIPQTVTFDTEKEMCNFKLEMEKLKNSFQLQKNETASKRLTIHDFNYPAARKSLFIGIMVIMINMLCGSFVMMNYTSTIFADAGSTLTPNMSAIVVCAIQLVATYLSSIFVERAGRKMLLCLSTFGIGTGIGILGAYSYAKTLGYNVEPYSWISVTSFSFGLFMSNTGISNLPFIVIAELLPEKIRSFGSSLCMILLWCMGFIMIKLFPTVSAAFGMHICFFLFSVCSLGGTIFIFLVIPETKGKSFQEIFQKLGGK